MPSSVENSLIAGKRNDLSQSWRGRRAVTWLPLPFGLVSGQVRQGFGAVRCAALCACGARFPCDSGLEGLPGGVAGSAMVTGVLA